MVCTAANLQLHLADAKMSKMVSKILYLKSENENLVPSEEGGRTKGKTAMTPTRDKALSHEEP